MSNNGLHSLYINTLSNLGFSDDLNNQLYLSTEGTNSMNSNLNMSNNNLINLANPVNNTDGVNLQYVNTLGSSYVLKASPIVSANFNMNNNKIINVDTGTNLNDAINKNQFDTAINTKLNLSGGTMSGNIDLNSVAKIINCVNPTSSLDVCNQQYAIFLANQRLSLNGGALFGNINMNSYKIINLGTCTLSTDASSKGYVDTAITTSLLSYLELTGGIMSGNIDMATKMIILSTLPTLDTHVSNKKFVDISCALKLDLSGGTLTGDLNMNSNKIKSLGTPTVGTDAVNKNYCDLFLPLSGGTLTGDVKTNNVHCSSFLTIGASAVNVYPLEITSSTSNSFTSGNAMTATTTALVTPTLTANISMKCANTIWSQARVIVSSDRRIKYDIEKIDYNTSNEIIKQIQPYKYKMIETNRDEYGYIAQEIRPIIPECIDIHTCKLPNGVTVDDYLTIDYKQINIHLMNTVKDLLQRIEKLEKIII